MWSVLGLGTECPGWLGGGGWEARLGCARWKVPFEACTCVCQPSLGWAPARCGQCCCCCYCPRLVPGGQRMPRYPAWGQCWHLPERSSLTSFLDRPSLNCVPVAVAQVPVDGCLCSPLPRRACVLCAQSFSPEMGAGVSGELCLLAVPWSRSRTACTASLMSEVWAKLSRAPAGSEGTGRLAVMGA